MELIAIEIHQNKRRWLFIGIYKPPSQSDNEFTNRLSLIIDYYSSKYENLILIGDFNLPTEKEYLDALIQVYNLNNLINKPTCFQSNTPAYIDLILTDKKNLFKLSDTFETGISDHHKLVSTILRGESRAAATSKMECFVIIVNDFQPLTIVTKHSILDVAAALDPPLILKSGIFK